MNPYLITTLVLTLGAAASAYARPVSYPGGWTTMAMHDADESSLHVHYSPNAYSSLGAKIINQDAGDINYQLVQYNRLLKRWNGPASQANVYLKSGVGVATQAGDAGGAAFSGFAADWETRRHFVSYETRLLGADGIDGQFKQSARVGVAPYVAEFGSLHTWLMLQVDHAPDAQDPVDVKPLVRFFKGTSLLEVGSSLRGGMMVNFIQRF